VRFWSALPNSSNNRSAFDPFGYAVKRDGRPRKSAPAAE
jgi:hypothetical protein